jgi:hypothetical protein
LTGRRQRRTLQDCAEGGRVGFRVGRFVFNSSLKKSAPEPRHLSKMYFVISSVPSWGKHSLQLEGNSGTRRRNVLVILDIIASIAVAANTKTT